MDISVLGLFLGLLLLAFPIYIMCAFRLRLMRRFFVSLARMVLTLVVAGAMMALLLRNNQVWASVLAGFVLALLSSVVIVARSGLRPGRLLAAVAVGSVLPLFVLSLYVLALVLSLKSPFDVRYFIPLFCLMVGSAAGLTARALRAYYVGLEHHNELYYYLLGNGATHREAVRHFMRRGFQAALLPAMRRMSSLFVTVAPALTLGLVMCGVGIWTAVFLEIVLMIAVVCYAISTFWLAVLLSRRYAFDGYERLRPMKRSESAEAVSDNSSEQDEVQDGQEPQEV